MSGSSPSIIAVFLLASSTANGQLNWEKHDIHTWGNHVPFGTREIAQGDINGDGNEDFCICSVGNGVPLEVYCFLNDGSGNFTSSRVGETFLSDFLSAEIYATRLGDLNGDGKLDLLLGFRANRSPRVFYGKGNGEFENEAIVLGEDNNINQKGSNCVYILDLDGDGDLDVFHVRADNQPFAFYINENNSGTFDGPTLVAGQAADSLVQSAAFGDFNGDGFIDFFSVTHWNHLKSRVYWGEETPFTWSQSDEVGSTGGKARTAHAFDWDGDGDLDVVVVRKDAAFRVYNNDGQGNFVESTLDAPDTQIGDGRHSSKMGDFDGDGNMDVQASIRMVTGNGDLSFNARVDIPISGEHAYCQAAAVADFDGDGDLDLICGGETTNVLYLNQYDNGGADSLLLTPDYNRALVISPATAEPSTAPSTAPSTPSTPTTSSNAVGDPHNLGGHGGRFDIRGRNNTWYVFLSTQNASVSLLIYYDDYWWRKKKVYGSWLKGISITATAQNHTLCFLYHVDSPSIATKGKEIHAGEAHEVEGVKVGLTNDHVFSFSNGAWEVEAKNRALPYKHINAKKRRLDVTIRPIGDVDHDPVAPHGLLGQTYDRDNKMVIGALDNYDIPGKVVVTKAMGEGAIEGVAQDYEVDGPFSTSFKFSRFGASGPVPPRNVSSLSGLILPAKYGVAGATNDEVDA